MKNRLLRPALGIMLLVLLGSTWYAWQYPALISAALSRLGLMVAGPAASDRRASGFIEAPTVAVAGEVSGEIARVLVGAGDTVSAGQP
ncbi:MAG: hypothetical protein WA089_19135, partial [Anaerolineae bacterium]